MELTSAAVAVAAAAAAGFVLGYWVRSIKARRDMYIAKIRHVDDMQRIMYKRHPFDR